jgi:hypothetical protein
MRPRHRQGIAQVNRGRPVGSTKLPDHRSIEQNPAMVIQHLGPKDDGRRADAGERREFRGEHPVPMLNPFDGERIAADVPIRNFPRAAQVLLHTARQPGWKGSMVGQKETTGLGGLPQLPGKGAPTGEDPRYVGEVEGRHTLSQ